MLAECEMRRTGCECPGGGQANQATGWAAYSSITTRPSLAAHGVNKIAAS